MRLLSRKRRQSEAKSQSKRNPTAVQSGNRSATPIWVSGRENDSRATVCVNCTERLVHAERAEASPGRESSAESIGPRPEVGKRKRTDRPTR